MLAVTVTAAVLGAAAPAAADVTVEPPSAPQGSGANVTFRVTNTAPKAITKVRVVLPKDTPIAEVFPLSVPDWAPQIENMKLAKPLTSVHGGAPVTETAAAITWIAMPGKALAPGKSADVAVALGPLPMVSQMRFVVEPTYADGKPGPALPAATLTLTPAAEGQQAPAHAGTSHGGGATGADPDEARYAELVAQAEQGGSFWSVAGWIVAALAGAAAVVAVLRGRRRGEPEPEADPDDEPDSTEPEAGEPVGAGAKVTSWSYRDGP